MADKDYLELLGYLHDELTSAEMDDFVQRLKCDPELAAQLLEIAEDEVRIIEWARTRALPGNLSGSTTVRSQAWRPSIFRAITVLAASVAIVLAVGLVIQSDTPRQLTHLEASNRDELSPVDDDEKVYPTDPIPVKETFFVSDTQDVVARVVSFSPDVKWNADNRPADFLMRFRPGDIVGVDTGHVQIEFSGGAILILKSPSLLQFTSPESARLLNGMVVGQVTNGNDFTLVTPTATVVDVGTEFGVAVGIDGTDVSVFDGEVHVHGLWATEASGSSVRQLESGMSVRVDPEGFHQSLPMETMARLDLGHKLLNPPLATLTQGEISLLDVIAGHNYSQHIIAGSIDPLTGYWGRPSGFDPTYWNKTVAGGDRQFVLTKWNAMVDGVFVPGENGSSLQIDSDGHAIRFPKNAGSTWGPIWSRRRFELDDAHYVLSERQNDYWGYGSLEAVSARLLQSRDGLLGLHANVGITFDLQAIRGTLADQATIRGFKALLANLDNSAQQDPQRDPSKVDLRIFVDGEPRFSRLGFGRSDGEAPVVVPLVREDRFLTIVTTDADGSIDYDHAVLVDPVIELSELSAESL